MSYSTHHPYHRFKGVVVFDRPKYLFVIDRFHLIIIEYTLRKGEFLYKYEFKLDNAS